MLCKSEIVWIAPAVGPDSASSADAGAAMAPSTVATAKAFIASGYDRGTCESVCAARMLEPKWLRENGGNVSCTPYFHKAGISMYLGTYLPLKTV